MARYVVNKYDGGVYCGNGFFDSLDDCYTFADDGFCDYMRIKDVQNNIELKVHLKKIKNNI